MRRGSRWRPIQIRTVLACKGGGIGGRGSQDHQGNSTRASACSPPPTAGGLQMQLPGAYSPGNWTRAVAPDLAAGKARPLRAPASRDEGAGEVAARWLAVPQQRVSPAFGGVGFVIVQASTFQLGLPGRRRSVDRASPWLCTFLHGVLSAPGLHRRSCGAPRMGDTLLSLPPRVLSDCWPDPWPCPSGTEGGADRTDVPQTSERGPKRTAPDRSHFCQASRPRA